MNCNRCGTQIENDSAFCPVCGNVIAADDDATVAADFDRTVASPELNKNAGSVPQYGYPQQASATSKKSVLPIVVGILAVLVVVLAGAFIFKEDIVDLFEKDTTSSRSDRKDKNKKDDEKDDDDNYGGLFGVGKSEEAVQTTINMAVLDKEFEEALRNTVPVPTRVQENVITEIVSNGSGYYEVLTEIVTDVVHDYSGLTSNDASAIADFYNQAVAKTSSVNGSKTLVLLKPIEGSGAMDTILKVLEPIVYKVLQANSESVYEIPGSSGGELLASDIASATAISKNGQTKIRITLKNQVDGPDSDKNNAGPVSRGIGTLGNIDVALEELGATLTSGRDTVKLTYKDAYIDCVVDDETGKIVSGTWKYTTDVLIGDAQMKLAINAALKNLTTSIEYKVVV